VFCARQALTRSLVETKVSKRHRFMLCYAMPLVFALLSPHSRNPHPDLTSDADGGTVLIRLVSSRLLHASIVPVVLWVHDTTWCRKNSLLSSFFCPVLCVSRSDCRYRVGHSHALGHSLFPVAFRRPVKQSTGRMMLDIFHFQFLGILGTGDGVPIRFLKTQVV
jgi:hypothetical protein